MLSHYTQHQVLVSHLIYIALYRAYPVLCPPLHTSIGRRVMFAFLSRIRFPVVCARHVQCSWVWGRFEPACRIRDSGGLPSAVAVLEIW
jgi:hypothetical protein